MPVFAKLSRRCYEVLGEDVIQQLVDWLNAVEEELTRRARLRSQNELSHLRSTARRRAAFSAALDSPRAAVDSVKDG